MKNKKMQCILFAVATVALTRLFFVSATETTAAEADKTVILGGNVVGVKLYTKGVHVLKLSNVETAQGVTEPAKKAGVKKGDYITHVNDTLVTDYQQFSNLLQNKASVGITISRNGESFKASLVTATGKDGVNRAGIWVRDSIAGLGTVTCYDPKTNKAYALGHGITDSDTGILLTPNLGKVYNATVTSVQPGSKGNAGALNGTFHGEEGFLGNVLHNKDIGVEFSAQARSGTVIPVAKHNQVREGEAVMYSTIEGEQPKAYTVRIKKVIKSSLYTTKGMIIEVTDNALLAKTGGIVCGMSGSPLEQDGRLVGAVTHVFLNDPRKGYAIFIENMLEEANKIK